MAGPGLGIDPVHGLAVESLGRVHHSIAQVAVVRNGEHLAARPGHVHVHVLPEFRGVRTVERGERPYLVHAVRAVTEDDGAMEVVAAGRRCPLEAVKSGEDVRPVPPFGGLGGVCPGRAGQLVALENGRAGLHRDDRFDRGLDACLRARPRHLVPALALRALEEFGAAGADLVGDAEILGMVSDRYPVERTVLPVALAVVEDDLAPRRNPEEVVRRQRDPEHSGVEREAGVHVRHAPEDSVREMLIRIRRVGRLGRLGSRTGRGRHIRGAGDPDVAASQSEAQHDGNAGRRPLSLMVLHILHLLSFGTRPAVGRLKIELHEGSVNSLVHALACRLPSQFRHHRSWAIESR